MTIDLDHLSKLAEAATPGNWKTEEDGRGYVNVVTDAKLPDRYIIGCEGFYRCDGFDEDNAAFIAALNPATVQELIRLARLGLTKETK